MKISHRRVKKVRMWIMRGKGHEHMAFYILRADARKKAIIVRKKRPLITMITALNSVMQMQNILQSPCPMHMPIEEFKRLRMLRIAELSIDTAVAMTKNFLVDPFKNIDHSEEGNDILRFVKLRSGGINNPHNPPPRMDILP